MTVHIGSRELGGDLTPDDDNTRDLGSRDLAFANIYTHHLELIDPSNGYPQLYFLNQYDPQGWFRGDIRWYLWNSLIASPDWQILAKIRCVASTDASGNLQNCGLEFVNEAAGYIWIQLLNSEIRAIKAIRAYENIYPHSDKSSDIGTSSSRFADINAYCFKVFGGQYNSDKQNYVDSYVQLNSAIREYGSMGFSPWWRWCRTFICTLDYDSVNDEVVVKIDSTTDGWIMYIDGSNLLKYAFIPNGTYTISLSSLSSYVVYQVSVADGTVYTDTIEEVSADHGIIIDGVKLKDKEVYARWMILGVDAGDWAGIQHWEGGTHRSDIVFEPSKIRFYDLGQSETMLEMDFGASAPVIVYRPLKVDEVQERTSDAGVTVEGSLLKDNYIRSATLLSTWCRKSFSDFTNWQGTVTEKSARYLQVAAGEEAYVEFPYMSDTSYTRSIFSKRHLAIVHLNVNVGFASSASVGNYVGYEAPSGSALFIQLYCEYDGTTTTLTVKAYIYNAGISAIMTADVSSYSNTGSSISRCLRLLLEYDGAGNLTVTDLGNNSSATASLTTPSDENDIAQLIVQSNTSTYVTQNTVTVSLIDWAIEP